MGSAADVEILFLDVDGVLTDGRVFVAGDGTHLKAFSIRDGAGIKLLERCGIRTAIISGHQSDATRARFERLGVEEIHVGIREKAALRDLILVRHGIPLERAAVMGDDLMDLAMMSGAGFTATVPDASPEVLSIADYVTTRNGGHGAVREVTDLILKARGLYEDLLDGFRA